jgi:hypothetical protein
VLNSTSASAIDRWEQCPRQWFGGYVEGDWPEQSEAQARGTAIDLEVQKHFQGKPVHPGWQTAVTGIVRLLPPSPRIQHKVLMPTYEGGPALVGYPDFLDEPEPGTVRVLDLKSLSDYRYAKTAEDLRTNTQIVTYSAWGWTLPGAQRVLGGHVAARFKKDAAHPVGYRFMDARLSKPAEMERGHVQEQWGKRLVLVKGMVEAARSAVRFEDLPPLGASDVDEFGKSGCERYGGCHFRGRCGFSVSLGISLKGDKMSNGPSLMEQLEAMKRASEQPQPVPGAPGTTMTMHLNPAPIVAALQPTTGAVAAGSWLPPPVTTPNPNHAHPGAVLPPDAGYKPGQPCNGKGYYASANGQGFIAVEPGHMCSACVGPGAINPSQVLPPDAPARESTPTEIRAVVEGKKRGRKKAASAMEGETLIEAFSKLGPMGFTTTEMAKLQREGTLQDALDGKITPGMLRQPPSLLPSAQKSQVQPAQQTPQQLPPTPSPQTPTPEPVQSQLPDPALAQAQQSWYQNSGPPAQQPILTPQAPVIVQQPAPPAPAVHPPAGLVLLVDCAPAKGTQATLLADWIGPVAEYACSQVLDDNGRPSPVPDLALVPYARGKGYLAAAVRLALGTVPPVLAIDSSVYGADKVLEILTPWAATIIRANGGAR